MRYRDAGGFRQALEGRLLASVPDLRDALSDYDASELARLFEDFDVEVAYNRALRLEATLEL